MHRFTPLSRPRPLPPRLRDRDRRRTIATETSTRSTPNIARATPARDARGRRKRKDTRAVDAEIFLHPHGRIDESRPIHDPSTPLARARASIHGRTTVGRGGPDPVSITGRDSRMYPLHGSVGARSVSVSIDFIDRSVSVSIDRSIDRSTPTRLVPSSRRPRVRDASIARGERRGAWTDARGVGVCLRRRTRRYIIPRVRPSVRTDRRASTRSRAHRIHSLGNPRARRFARYATPDLSCARGDRARVRAKA